MIIKMKWKINYNLLFVVILIYISSNWANELSENITDVSTVSDYENVTQYENETSTDYSENITTTTTFSSESNDLSDTTTPYYNETISTTTEVESYLNSTEFYRNNSILSENVTANNGNDDYDSDEQKDTIKCHEGLLLRAWKPNTHLKFGDRLARGLVYFLVMCYLFLGVSIVSDRFMAAIEVITAKEKEVTVRKPDGSTQTVVVRVWNETVANLTLMALGTSAPEILLSVIEIFANKFQAGDLGPGTIVGSAAYNLCTIIGLCILVIPKGEVRRIKHLRVFFVTATWSVFAYIWLYLILAYFSPGVVTIGEGLLTFICFPLTVLTAYIADRRLLVYKYFGKGYRMNERGIMVQTETDTPSELKRFSLKGQEEELLSGDYKDFEQAKRDYIEILKELKQKYPQYERDRLEVMAQEQLINDVPKSRAFYRIQATRKMVGGGNIMKRLTERAQNDLQRIDTLEDETISKIYFDPDKYNVMENCGVMECRVVRRGGFSRQVRVDYETEDGSAEAGADYVPKNGTLVFAHGVEEQFIKIGIIDDDIFEQNESFFVRLTNPSIGAILAAPKIATVMILDDDHCGIFTFADEGHELNESVGTYELKVQRCCGARGNILLPYSTEDGTAKAGKDYEQQKGELLFENNECE